MKLVLASGSPRRKEILSSCGFDFTVRIKEVDENISEKLSPVEYALCLAKRKAEAVPCYEDESIITADTIVAYNDLIMGKPKNRQEAYDMLKMLSGKTHSVYTAVCIKNLNGTKSFCEETKVEFYDLSDEDINNYLDTGEAFDKAGSYGIQGKAAVFVKGIIGDYFNVVGLPIARLSREIK